MPQTPSPSQPAQNQPSSPNSSQKTNTSSVQSLQIQRLRSAPLDPKSGKPLRSEASGEAFTPPTRTHPTDAGIDLTASSLITIGPGLSARISHNFSCAIPDGMFAIILPRSSTLQAKGLIVIPGVIDPGFRGEVQTVVFNPTQRPVQVQAGERLSQLCLYPFLPVGVEVVADLPPAPDRGDKGFGSSGGFATTK